MKAFRISMLLFVMFLRISAWAQLSPGDLVEAHAHLEGLSNCTKCHTLGEKVSNEKCLACHTEIKHRITRQSGYHSSTAVKGKECASCHSDHHGRTFKIVKFEPEKFNHQLTGYTLNGAHSKLECKDCHKAANIKDPAAKKKKFTYLGLGKDCLSCHEDYHQKSLAANCLNCHNYDKFKPALKFDHNKAKFKLKGKHQEVECAKCHKTEIRNGKNMQVFIGLQFGNCVNCHTDVHNNKFGSDCRKCHSEESFHSVKSMTDFDHNKTNFRLEDKHQFVDCRSCHKKALTDPVKHERCTDCHKDYHEGQFAVAGKSPDCRECHSPKGFPGSSFTIDRHQQAAFKLEGAHLATPCFSCHKKQDKWSFRNIGSKCSDCHNDIHSGYMNPEFFTGSNCNNCHSVNRWSEVTFDHSRTKFSLSGVHARTSCRSCHFIKQETGGSTQKFTGFSNSCIDCHADIHFSQFAVDGSVDCTRCHEFENWKATKFDHNKAAFKLDGKHQVLACEKCHKPVTENGVTYVLYKIKEYKCESCH